LKPGADFRDPNAPTTGPLQIFTAAVRFRSLDGARLIRRDAREGLTRGPIDASGEIGEFVSPDGSCTPGRAQEAPCRGIPSRGWATGMGVLAALLKRTGVGESESVALVFVRVAGVRGKHKLRDGSGPRMGVGAGHLSDGESTSRGSSSLPTVSAAGFDGEVRRGPSLFRRSRAERLVGVLRGDASTPSSRSSSSVRSVGPAAGLGSSLSSAEPREKLPEEPAPVDSFLPAVRRQRMLWSTLAMEGEREITLPGQGGGFSGGQATLQCSGAGCLRQERRLTVATFEIVAISGSGIRTTGRLGTKAEVGLWCAVRLPPNPPHPAR